MQAAIGPGLLDNDFWVVVQFGCHPEQALFAQRRACPELAEGIRASRASRRAFRDA